MNSNQGKYTYKQGMTSKELTDYLKAALLPIGVFFLCTFVITQFGLFGKNIVAPASGIMWIAGVVVAVKIPSQRRSTLNETYAMLAGYNLGLYLIRFIIGLAANTSSEQLMATYQQALPMSTGSTISGYLQSMLWILAFITPVTFLTVMGKKFISFRKTAAKNKILEQIRGIRER